MVYAPLLIWLQNSFISCLVINQLSKSKFPTLISSQVSGSSNHILYQDVAYIRARFQLYRSINFTRWCRWYLRWCINCIIHSADECRTIWLIEVGSNLLLSNVRHHCVLSSNGDGWSNLVEILWECRVWIPICWQMRPTEDGVHIWTIWQDKGSTMLSMCANSVYTILQSWWTWTWQWWTPFRGKEEWKGADWCKTQHVCLCWSIGSTAG